jgi:autotransporter-associated beta strand protein
LFTTQVPQTNAASGAWSVDADGLWSDNTKWLSGIVGTGAGNIADFSTLDITANRTVTLDSSRSIGTLKFGDVSGAQNWFVNSSGSAVLTLNSGSSGSPGIVVNNNLATLEIPIAGTNGFTKSGPGTLVLAATNMLSGPLNLDRGIDGNNNDGVTLIANPGAIANVSSINIRNTSVSSAGGATLQLNGSAGGITVTQNISATCRNNSTTPTIESLAGTNTLAGANYIQVDGTNVIYQSDAGSLLQITAPVQYIGTLTAARTYTFTGAGNIAVTGPLLASTNAAPISMIKSGSGTLTLGGVNTYTNGTTVNGGAVQVNGSLAIGRVNVTAGSFGGAGAIAGPVNISGSATLAPGSSIIGTLTINNSLTNDGVTAIRLNKTGSTLTNDNIQAVACVLNGTLSLTNISSGTVTVGDGFKLFSAGTYRVFFSNIIPATPGTNLLWNTNNLGVNGTLTVALGNVNPQFGPIYLAGANLVMTGSGGAAGYNFSVLSSTNLTTPLTNWVVSGSGLCDSSGAFKITNSLSPNSPQVFYTIRIP